MQAVCGCQKALLGTALTLTVVGMAGCGGGGGDAEASEETALPEDGSSTSEVGFLSAEEGEGVLVAIVDDGVRETHNDFRGETHIERTIPSEFSDKEEFGDMVHGTRVASVALGDQFGQATEADLLEIDLKSFEAPDGGAYFVMSDVQRGVARALEAGARVVNSSYTNDYQMIQEQSYQTVSAIGDFGALWVSSAGNEGMNLSTDPASPGQFYDQFDGQGNGILRTKFGDSRVAPYHLYVGGVYEDGFSSEGVFNFPGEYPVIQKQFVTTLACTEVATADSDTSYGTACGTSYSAPRVAGIIAEIWGKYPSLTVAEVRESILETADRSFTEAYADESCGQAGDVNCGLFYFGQGRVDAEAATVYAAGLAQATY